MDSVELYNYLYTHAMHNQKGLYGLYGRRDPRFVKFIKENLPDGGSIIDLSCGRGTLLRWLMAEGYNVSGTEIATDLLRPGGELYGLPVKSMAYSELKWVDGNKYDVVISNDVLEHLDNKQEVMDAMCEMARISKQFILVSTGGWRAARCPFREELGISNLHNIIETPDWWEGVFTDFCKLNEKYFLTGSYFFFGTKK